MSDYKTLKVSADEIERAKSKRGGWTRAQLAKWGVPWPAPHGWRNALLEGEPIPPHVPAAIPFSARVTCSPREAKEYTGIGRDKLYELIADGRIETVKLDGRRLVSVASLLKLVTPRA